jgi:hypothetical protein
VSKYRIEWTEEFWYSMEVEAESESQALDNFHSMKYDFDNAESIGQEIQDSIYIEEVK